MTNKVGMRWLIQRQQIVPKGKARPMNHLLKMSNRGWRREAHAHAFFSSAGRLAKGEAHYGAQSNHTEQPPSHLPYPSEIIIKNSNKGHPTWREKMGTERDPIH